MSFILDALKKSETDRQRKASPETSHVPVASGDRGPTRWVWVVGVLLAANMVALIYVLVQPDAPPRPAVVTTTEPAPQTAATTVDEDRRQTLARSAEQAASSPVDAVERQATALPTRPPEERAFQNIVPEESVALPVAATAADAEPSADFMTFSEARVAGMQVDDLALELHVFSTAPAERFVFINMGKYREGETLTEGPKVREIRPDGVLLEYTGTLFLLPRE